MRKWVEAEEGELINLDQIRTIDITYNEHDPKGDCSVVAYSGDPCLAGNCHTIYDGTRQECDKVKDRIKLFLVSDDQILFIHTGMFD